MKYSFAKTNNMKRVKCASFTTKLFAHNIKTLIRTGNKSSILKGIGQLKYASNVEDWNSITGQDIQKTGKSLSKNQKQGYWENKENVLHFLLKLKEKYNLNTPEDWNSLTTKHITSNGGWALLSKYSIFELKCMACPEGKSLFNNPKGFWENQENILKFLSVIKEKYNLNTPEDWNSITQEHIISHNGGWALSRKYSMFELKCFGCPEGKSLFSNPKGYWENQENILKFLSEIKEKYNLNTPEEWNSITQEHITSNNGGGTLLKKYSMFELKCMACPEGKSVFNNQKQSAGYWENKENIHHFLLTLKEKYNLNTPEDWNSITHNHVKSNGGASILNKYSVFEIKCMACPEGKSLFNNPRQPPEYWEIKENIEKFLSQIKEKYDLHTPEDWKRISKDQIISQGGRGLINNKNLKVNVKFETENNSTKYIPLSTLISKAIRKRSSQRWLFLQVQKLYPNEEIVEDYFHSEISRTSGANVQFDIFMIKRNIAIEYHGKQHYEDIPQAFSNVETYKQRDFEKQKLCEEHGIQLIVIPYWWNNKIESLRETLYSKIN